MATRTRKRRADPVPPRLHELEAQVMETVWKLGESPVRPVMEKLNRPTKQRAYTTYMTIMARLHKKGMLERRRRGKTDYYSPAYERAEYLRLRAKAEVRELVASYGDAALGEFASQMASLDPVKRRAIQRLARQQA